MLRQFLGAGFSQEDAMWKSRTLLLLVVVVGLMPAGPGAQAPPSGGSAALTDQDRAEIRDLVARYARALGRCAADDYAQLFTPDGVFTSDDFRGRKHREIYGRRGTLRGRDELAQLVRTEDFCLDGSPRDTAGASRPVPIVDIQRSPEGARGSAPIGRDGRYDDVYVKTADGWRFKSRTVKMPSVAPSAVPAPGAPPAAGSFTTSDGVGLHYTDSGRGRAMVFVPGWTMSGDIWEPQIRAFSSR
jgi:hypothetical protein